MEELREENSSYYIIKNNDLAPVLNSFTSLCQETVLHDVTLACGDGKMETSRALLALAFPPLEEVLKTREEDVLLLIMPDFIQTEIKQLLKILLSCTLENTGFDPDIDKNKSRNSNEEMFKHLDMEIDTIKPEITVTSLETPDVEYLELTDRNEVEKSIRNVDESIKEENSDTTALDATNSTQSKNLTPICYPCGKVFGNILSLEKHIQTHEDKVCNVCGKLFAHKYRFHYKRHIESHKKVPKIHKKYKKYIKYSDRYQVLCIFCEYKFKSNANDQFISHIKEHLSKKESEESMSLTFEYYVSELVRLEEMLLDESKGKNALKSRDKYGNFNCDACEFNSKVLKEVRTHRKNDHFGGKRPQSRAIWHTIRTKQTQILNEMKKRSFIPNGTPLQIRLCTPWNIEVLKKYQPTNTFQLKCDTCDFGTRHLSKLRSHKLTAHKTAKFECDVCGESNFMTFTWVKQHQMEKHNMWGGMLSCGHCEEKFTKEGLRRHTRSITGVKRKCPECHNFYSHVYHHINSVHRGVPQQTKKYCSGCKTYYGRRRYDTHLCCPIPGKVYQPKTKCGICKETFKNHGSFNVHLQNDHLLTISRELGLSGDIKTENIELREEIAGIFVVSHFVKSEKANHMLCKLCLRIVKDYSNKMAFHMKTHLGFSNMKKVRRNTIITEAHSIEENQI